MIKRTTTKWVHIEPLGIVTRIHYPIFAGKWLVKLDKVCFGTFRGKCIRIILKVLGVWQEYRAMTLQEWRKRVMIERTNTLQGDMGMSDIKKMFCMYCEYDQANMDRHMKRHFPKMRSMQRINKKVEIFGDMCWVVSSCSCCDDEDGVCAKHLKEILIDMGEVMTAKPDKPTK